MEPVIYPHNLLIGLVSYTELGFTECMLMCENICAQNVSIICESEAALDRQTPSSYQTDLCSRGLQSAFTHFINLSFLEVV